jgi:hypothetical protein
MKELRSITLKLRTLKLRMLKNCDCGTAVATRDFFTKLWNRVFGSASFKLRNCNGGQKKLHVSIFAKLHDKIRRKKQNVVLIESHQMRISQVVFL